MSRLDARRQQLLAAMGITAWQPRATQQQSVPSAPSALLVVVGQPDVETGQSGELLTNMLAAIGFPHRQGVVICAVESADAREKTRLEGVIEQAQPLVILALGQTAAQALTGRCDTLDALRAHWYEAGAQATPAYVSFHPADLLADPRLKAKAWEDLIAVQSALPEAA